MKTKRKSNAASGGAKSKNPPTTIPATPPNSPDNELTRPTLASLLAGFKTAEGQPKYGMIQDKPVIFIDVKTVLTFESEKFQDKLLCDGLTKNAGDACVFSCTFCYVPAAMLKLHSAKLAEFNRETGLNLDLSQVVIRRRGFLDVLKNQLLNPDGSRIYNDPDDHRVLYSSTLVDVAGNMELLRETAAACLLIFENTEWQIRLLSKSPLLAMLVTKGLIPEKYHHRLILGFSTGTLDDELAAAIEQGTGKVSLRIKALHELQDLGIRTFGMICPSLPYGTQEEYDEFSRAMCEALRVERCEHVWAEVINLRGDSLTKTVEALRNPAESKTGKRKPAFPQEADRLEAVSGPGSKEAWEEYARMTFEAHKKYVPADKLRFLQYVKADTAPCWSCQRHNGAVLLGSYAEKNDLITIATSAPSEPLPDPGADDIRYREEREQIVTHAVNQRLAASKALHEINTYRDGLLWRKEFRTFTEYCSRRWGYEKSHAYRQVQAGGLVAKLEQSHSPIGENAGITESHLRPLCEMVPEDLQVECWKEVTESIPEGSKVTAAQVKKEVKRFLKKKGVEPKNSKAAKPAKPDDRESALRDMAKFRSSLSKLNPPERFESMFLEFSNFINQEPDGASIDVESKEVIASDGMHEKDFASSAHDLVSSRRGKQADGEAIPDDKVVITAEIVTAAMVAVAPTHEQSMGTAKLEMEPPVYQRNLAVSEKCVRTATAESESQQDTAHFMSAQLFHEVLHPGEDYAAWLNKIAESHPADVRIPNDGGAASISLVRARHFAFHKNKSTEMTALKLINEAQSSRNGNPGATADALFQQHALAAIHSSS